MMAVKNTFISIVDAVPVPRGRVSSPDGSCHGGVTQKSSLSLSMTRMQPATKSSVSTLSMTLSQFACERPTSTLVFSSQERVTSTMMLGHRLSVLGDLAKIWKEENKSAEAESTRRAEVEQHKQGRETVNTHIAKVNSSSSWDVASVDCSLLPTVGSALHGAGQCVPCAFVHKERGCAEGYECQFCHLCDRSDYIARRKMKAKNGKLKKRSKAREENCPL